jgi:hypothetical protein
MATKVLTNAFLLFNAVDFSNHLITLEVPEGFESQDFTAMSGTTRVFKPGLATGQYKATLFQDYAVGSIDATLAAAAGLIVAVEARSDAGARAVTNPAWVSTGFWSSYNPVAGEVGGRQTCEVTIEISSVIQRLTA